MQLTLDELNFLSRYIHSLDSTIYRRMQGLNAHQLIDEKKMCESIISKIDKAIIETCSKR